MSSSSSTTDNFLSFLLEYSPGIIQLPFTLDPTLRFDIVARQIVSSATASSPAIRKILNTAEPPQKVMFTRTITAAFNLVRAVMGFRRLEPDWTMMPTTLFTGEGDHHRSIRWSAQANQELLSQIDQAENTPELEEPLLGQTSESRRPSAPVIPNGATRPDAHALLKGSPKALGWDVDEENEQRAWLMLMGDAMGGTVFELDDTTQEVLPTAPVPQTREELYRMYLKHWDDEHTTLVWRVVPSLKGQHKWKLEPKLSDEHTDKCGFVTTAEAGTDTDDLVAHHHTEMSTQTDIRSYATTEIQTEDLTVKRSYAAIEVQTEIQVEPEVPVEVLSLQSPLENTIMEDVLVSEPQPITPSENAIESRPSTPNGTRIPRMTTARRGSIASNASSTRGRASEVKAPRDSSPIPSRVPTAVRRSPSVRSLALKRSPSTKPSVDKSDPSVTSPPLPAPPAETPAPKEAESQPLRDASPPPAPQSPSLYNVVKLVGRTNSWLSAWRP